MIIGTAGHIDHGKTALVKALTGVDTDRLKEEKARGISIDLGYAYLPVRQDTILGFIDVPGHERFIRNMLAGATGIDFGLLVVAADDGVMPQTREHYQILCLLGLRQGAIVVTKTDKASSGRIDEVIRQIREMADGSFLEDAPVFPVCALTGDGIDELRQHLADCATVPACRTAEGYFRLAIDRSFSLPGRGTVVTGTVFSGSIAIGDKPLLAPSGMPVRVRSIYAQNRAVERGQAGERCAINIVGAEAKDARRGDWLLEDPLHLPASHIDAMVTVLPGEDEALRHWAPVHVHHAASDVTGRIAVLESDRIEPGASGLAQLVLDKPICAVHGDRFVMRDQSARRTLAGGVVLDPFGRRRKRRMPQRLAMLAALLHQDKRRAVAGYFAAAPDGLLLSQVAIALNLRPAEVSHYCKGLVQVQTREGEIGFDPQIWEKGRQDILHTLDRIHSRLPDGRGAEPAQLLATLSCPLSARTFRLQIECLLAQKVLSRDGNYLRLAAHRPAGPQIDIRLWQRTERLFHRSVLEPQSLTTIARELRLPEARARTEMMKLVDAGELYQLEKDVYLLRSAVLHFAEVIRQMAADHADGEVTLPAFRDRIGMGRRYAVKLLEFYDRVGVTRFVGNAHRLRKDAHF